MSNTVSYDLLNAFLRVLLNHGDAGSQDIIAFFNEIVDTCLLLCSHTMYQ